MNKSKWIFSILMLASLAWTTGCNMNKASSSSSVVSTVPVIDYSQPDQKESYAGIRQSAPSISTTSSYRTYGRDRSSFGRC